MSRTPGETRNVYKLHKSQKDKDYTIAPLISIYHSGKPIPVILGMQPNKSALQSKHYFSVLGWYVITHLWSEYDLGTLKRHDIGIHKERYHVRKKVRLQYIQHQPYKKWWRLDTCPTHADRKFIHMHCRTYSRLCRKCNKMSPLVYKDGFICLNEECRFFWMLAVSEDLFQTPNEEMDLNSCFTYSQQPTLIEKNFQEPFSLFPALNSDSIRYVRGLSVDITRGIHCVKCGKLSSREEWFGWQCLNCKEWIELEFPALGLYDILDPFERVYTGLRIESGLLYLNTKSGIQYAEKVSSENKTSIHYYLPNLGEITHFLSGIEEKERAENIFKAYQQRGTNRVNFKRYAFHLTKVQRRFLGNQFQFNSGELYDHTLATDTVSMEDSPPPIKEALKFIQDRIGQTSFNQVSSLLYMKGHRMDWHDDGEDIVKGPVATFTMGSSAQMWFREKRVSKKTKAPPFLKLVLSHGDVLVMWNKAIQRSYQHCIKPEGFRIAVTARSMKI